VRADGESIGRTHRPIREERVMLMNGNIDPSLQIVAGDATRVVTTGWIDFEAGDPDQVEVWVGVGQGDKKNGTAVYGEGVVVVDRPAGGKRATWQAETRIENGAGTYKNGPADAGAVVISGAVEPYPWGREVKLQK
jgi:hypothetical protein